MSSFAGKYYSLSVACSDHFSVALTVVQGLDHILQGHISVKQFKQKQLSDLYSIKLKLYQLCMTMVGKD